MDKEKRVNQSRKPIVKIEMDNCALITVSETARILRVSIPYVYKMVSQGTLKAVTWRMQFKGKKPNPVIRIDAYELQKFIESNRT